MDDTDAYEDAPITALANPRLMQEAISNVLDNAIEYASAGCEVTVQIRRMEDVACLVILVNCPGIPADF
jgi:signal transduction histidine kinase